MLEEKFKGILLNPIFSRFRPYLTLAALVGTSIMGCSGGSNTKDDAVTSDGNTWSNGFTQENNSPDTYSPLKDTKSGNQPCFKDNDNDGIGSSNTGWGMFDGCPAGWSSKNGDCDDANPDFYKNCPQNDADTFSSNADVSVNPDTLTDAYNNKNIVEIAAGYYHACARTSTNDVYCWGYNKSGQLGDESNTDSYYPVKVHGLAGYTIKQLSAGAFHTCAIAHKTITDEDVVLCWGSNDSGQGGYKGNSASIPTLVEGLNGQPVTQVATGTNHTLVLTNEGKIYAFGDNLWGQIGNGTFGSGNDRAITIPTKVVGLPGYPSKVKLVAAGQATSYAVTNDQKGWSWGVDNGALGNEETGNKNTPTPIKYLDGKTFEDLGKITQISTKTYSVFALFDTGAVYWGKNGAGNAWLGEEGLIDYPEPIKLPDLEGLVTQISCGEQHSFVTLSDGQAGGFGNNAFGQLGNSSTTGVYSKDDITWLYGGDQKVKQVAAGQWYTLVLLDDGSVQFMGNNEHGQGGNGDTNDRYVPTLVLFPED